jgi:hypothetical protein
MALHRCALLEVREVLMSYPDQPVAPTSYQA